MSELSHFYYYVLSDMGRGFLCSSVTDTHQPLSDKHEEIRLQTPHFIIIKSHLTALKLRADFAPK